VKKLCSVPRIWDLAVTHVNIIRKNRNNERRYNQKEMMDVQDCHYCGKDHMEGGCPAYGKNCDKCLGRYRFARNRA
jgi:hypothetical protein